MFKNFFKKFFLLALLVATSFFPFTLKSEEQPYFELIIEDEFSQELYGVEHRKIIGKISLNGVLTNQQINYTAANIKENDNLFAVAGDNYDPHGYGASNLRAQTYVVNQRYQHQARVVSGVNGDFFDIRGNNVYGLSSGPHIRDYRTIHEGNTGSTLIGIHDDGSVTIGNPKYTGYEVIVLDDEGSQKKHQIKVDGFNRLPEEGEVTAFFVSEDGPTPIVSPEPKMVFTGIDVKSVEKINRYFGEGKISHVTTKDIDVEHGEFVLMGDAVFAEDLITEKDTVLVQNVLGGIHKGIRNGISGGFVLLKDGEIMSSDNNDVHPRTAVGVKADGTLIFVTVDGRQPPNMAGVDYEQLAHLMKYFGAVDAVNVDGGGSSTMLFYNEEKDYYDTQNSPSDNPMSIRSVSNGLFFMYGNLEPRLPAIPYPDTRDVLDAPTNLYFDENQVLRFNKVDNALYYTLTVDGKRRYKIEDNSFNFDLGYGEYEFELKAFGDFDVYRQSNTEKLTVSIYSSGMLDFIDGLKEYGKRANKS